ncbi:MAG: asparagine synthase (glutamine-hydrolyzing) [Bacteroidia bacterium]|nr:asparagine synthase (glutamine-hydrolyzing) [Bacteroidia bacterium]
MCGINIILSSQPGPVGLAAVQRMNDAIAHRGPDDTGIFSGGKVQHVFLGHRRLSIIDLTAAGHQPMTSSDDRFVIVYNGEIYNFCDLRLDLSRAMLGSSVQPYGFTTETDTEVILAAYKAWGTECVKRLDGMFAFAIWDKQEETLFIARDRFGKKPLYYWASDEMMIFSSEIRGILASGLVKPVLNSSALCEYFQYQTVYGQDTLIRNIRLLEAGTCAVIKDGKMKGWKYHETPSSHRTDLQSLTLHQIRKMIHEGLSRAVEKRLVSDVPFGAFLSGGIDSSAIVGLMSRMHTGKVKTFSVVFREQEFSEQQYADRVASKFNTDHTNIVLSVQDFLNTIPDALAAMDHPGGDGPNTYVVAGATRKAGIKMALSGIGGDELFAGYDVFKRIHKMRRWWWLNLLPPDLRKMLALPANKFRQTVKTEKIASFLQAGTDIRELYRVSRQVFSDDQVRKLVQTNCGWEIRRILKDIPELPDNFLLSQLSLNEMHTYLHSVLLRDTDVMSMAHGLEVRAPFLDPSLVDLILGIRDEWKFPHSPKKLLTDSLGDLLPAEVIHRKKMGFTLPWEHWMRKELYTLCDSKIRSLSQRGFIGKITPVELWERFLKKDPSVTWSRLWHLVVLEDWMQRHAVNE